MHSRIGMNLICPRNATVHTGAGNCTQSVVLNSVFVAPESWNPAFTRERGAREGLMKRRSISQVQICRFTHQFDCPELGGICGDHGAKGLAKIHALLKEVLQLQIGEKPTSGLCNTSCQVLAHRDIQTLYSS